MGNRGIATADHGIPMVDRGIAIIALPRVSMVVRGTAHGRSCHCYDVAMAWPCMTMALPCSTMARPWFLRRMPCPVQTPQSCHGTSCCSAMSMPFRLIYGTAMACHAIPWQFPWHARKRHGKCHQFPWHAMISAMANAISSHGMP